MMKKCTVIVTALCKLQTHDVVVFVIVTTLSRLGDGESLLTVVRVCTMQPTFPV